MRPESTQHAAQSLPGCEDLRIAETGIILHPHNGAIEIEIQERSIDQALAFLQHFAGTAAAFLLVSGGMGALIFFLLITWNQYLGAH